MSRFPNLFIVAGIGTAGVLTLAANFADRMVSPMPDAPRVMAAVEGQGTFVGAANASNGETSNGGFGLGREALPEEIAAWNLDITPDGEGLPEGSGDVWTGEEVFVEKCAVCHGDFAEGVDNWPQLAGGENTLDQEDPVKTVGSYWPHLSTAFDYVRRSMPYGAAQSLTDDEVYATVAYILYSNYIVEDDFVLSNENFNDIEMPNADGFYVDDREEAEQAFWESEPCMEDCKEDVEITMRARVLDVTPDQEGVPSRDEAMSGSADGDETETAQAQEAQAEDGQAEEDAAAEDDAAESGAPDPELVAAGEKTFRQCKACHMVGENAQNRVGPQLNGIMGREAGAVDGFRYSNALLDMAEDGLVWTEENMAEFLEDPRGYIQGTKMSYAGLRDEEDRDAIIAYLSTFSE